MPPSVLARWLSQACKSATGYNTVFRLPVPTRTHGMIPARVHPQSVRAEIPKAFAASRGRMDNGS